jgi:hypothetical protein
MQVRAWDAGSDGTVQVPLTFDQAVGAGKQWGFSQVFTYTQDYTDPADPSDYFMYEFRGFSLVPEPSTWALAAVGVGWLFWRQRKRAESKV